MAYTALDAVNRVLRRVGEIQGDAGELTSFIDSPRQRAIDTALQIINEAINWMYDRGVFSNEVAEGTITLATGTREYALPADFVQITGQRHDNRVLKNVAKNRRLYEYAGGYQKMYVSQIDPADYAGDPFFWTINPETNKIRIDRTPQADQNGDAYTFLYDKQISIVSPSDSFPFTDTVFDSLVPALAEGVRAELRGETRLPVYASSQLAVAMRANTQLKSRRSYGVRRGLSRA